MEKSQAVWRKINGEKEIESEDQKEEEKEELNTETGRKRQEPNAGKNQNGPPGWPCQYISSTGLVRGRYKSFQVACSVIEYFCLSGMNPGFITNVPEVRSTWY